MTSRRQAAAQACAAFEQRIVNKEYLAVLQGNLKSQLHQWPLLDEHQATLERLSFVEDEIETNKQIYLKSLQEEKIAKTDQTTESWQNEVKKQNLLACFEALHSTDMVIAIFTFSFTYSNK